MDPLPPAGDRTRSDSATQLPTHSLQSKDRKPDGRRDKLRGDLGLALWDWIANPSAISPYTPMPVNIPYDPTDKENLGGVSQELYRDTSIEQLDAMVDLLANYDEYVKRRSLVSPLVGRSHGGSPQTGASTSRPPGATKTTEF
jgi:hypothetical protein